MHPGLHAQSTPDKAAVIMAGSGEVVTYRELDERSNRLLLWAQGLRPGDHVAIFAENHPRFFEVFWARPAAGCTSRPSTATSRRRRRRTS